MNDPYRTARDLGQFLCESSAPDVNDGTALKVP
jgi:hypothetical protein